MTQKRFPWCKRWRWRVKKGKSSWWKVISQSRWRGAESQRLSEELWAGRGARFTWVLTVSLWANTLSFRVTWMLTFHLFKKWFVFTFITLQPHHRTFSLHAFSLPANYFTVYKGWKHLKMNPTFICGGWGSSDSIWGNSPRVLTWPDVSELWWVYTTGCYFVSCDLHQGERRG